MTVDEGAARVYRLKRRTAYEQEQKRGDTNIFHDAKNNYSK